MFGSNKDDKLVEMENWKNHIKNVERL